MVMTKHLNNVMPQLFSKNPLPSHVTKRANRKRGKKSQAGEKKCGRR